MKTHRKKYPSRYDQRQNLMPHIQEGQPANASMATRAYLF